MIRLIAAELFKLRTTRTFYGISADRRRSVLVIADPGHRAR